MERGDKWEKLNDLFEEKSEIEKEKYNTNIVQDLKSSNQGQWYSKIKRMSEVERENPSTICVEEISEYSNEIQAEMIADHYAHISNQYKKLEKDDFPSYYSDPGVPPPYVPPHKVQKIIRTMNRKSSTVLDDIPMKLIHIFQYELSFPLAHIINVCLREGIHPAIWKTEIVTPAPKIYPTGKMKI